MPKGNRIPRAHPIPPKPKSQRGKPPPTKKGKATNIEASRRTDEVVEMLCKGFSRAQIIQHAAEKWHISARATDNYLAKAAEILRKESETVGAEERAKAIRRLTFMYKQASLLQDYQRAIAAQRELNLLLGLHAPRKFSVEIQPAHAAILKELGIAPSEAWQMLMQSLAEQESGK